jgi:hypothetical protein
MRMRRGSPIGNGVPVEGSRPRASRCARTHRTFDTPASTSLDHLPRDLAYAPVDSAPASRRAAPGCLRSRRLGRPGPDGATVGEPAISAADDHRARGAHSSRARFRKGAGHGTRDRAPRFHCLHGWIREGPTRATTRRHRQHALPHRVDVQGVRRTDRDGACTRREALARRQTLGPPAGVLLPQSMGGDGPHSGQALARTHERLRRQLAHGLRDQQARAHARTRITNRLGDARLTLASGDTRVLLQHGARDCGAHGRTH